ncbi:CTD kinase subunit alpha-like [Dendronephthya gigantea]|uniref:CTD kinase subunit alpha-like n=1 Tax=Dendronephthya gigantea TaxID=151771 RepID=UPI00106B4500|nr:CTD kinase subunit alpha-like [Dendronephthya gigantea]
MGKASYEVSQLQKNRRMQNSRKKRKREQRAMAKRAISVDGAAVGNTLSTKMIAASVKQISPSDLLPLAENTLATAPVGSGTYGECVLKKFKRLGVTVLEKKLPTSDLQAVMNEVQCMNTLTHASIPYLLGVQIEEKPFSLVMQFLGEDTESVTIHKLLHANQTMAKPLTLTTNEWISILLDIAEALSHVHNKGFLHCDVKSNNVLVAGKKGFLIDFGKKLAKFLGQQLESTLPFTIILPLRF